MITNIEDGINNVELMISSPFHDCNELNQDTTPMIIDVNNKDWDLLWRNVTKIVDIKVYNKKINKTILSNSSGYVKAGEMLAIVFDDKIISHPVINEPILGGEGIISGNMTPEMATDIALLLRAGALPVPLKIIEERLVGPTLGMESIKDGIKACIIASLLVFAIMLGYYRFFGLIASVALVINFIMMISVLSIFGATLTLPGIAGIVLTLGMAVDANVLIFERVKEELKKGMVPLNALHNGYKYAFITIFDSNTTTILVAIVLYIFGTGPTKGFAVTLIVGILCSMFTSISITKAIITLWYRAKNQKLLICN